MGGQNPLMFLQRHGGLRSNAWRENARERGLLIRSVTLLDRLGSDGKFDADQCANSGVAKSLCDRLSRILNCADIEITHRELKIARLYHCQSDSQQAGACLIDARVKIPTDQSNGQ